MTHYFHIGWPFIFSELVRFIRVTAYRCDSLANLIYHADGFVVPCISCFNCHQSKRVRWRSLRVFCGLDWCDTVCCSTRKNCRVFRLGTNVFLLFVFIARCFHCSCLCTQEWILNARQLLPSLTNVSVDLFDEIFLVSVSSFRTMIKSLMFCLS